MNGIPSWLANSCACKPGPCLCQTERLGCSVFTGVEPLLRRDPGDAAGGYKLVHQNVVPDNPRRHDNQHSEAEYRDPSAIFTRSLMLFKAKMR